MLSAATARRAGAQDTAAEAKRHFEIGLDLVQRRAFDSALAEFLRSRTLLPTAGAMSNAAVCLRELGRADEALDQYESLLVAFGPQLSPSVRRAVDADVAALLDHVGAIDVTSDPPGAGVVVDGRARGNTPAHVRVTAGRHVVSVTAEGRAPFEQDVHASAHGETAVAVKLPSVARIGTIAVSEASGRVFEVLVDGGVVGVTPWRGTFGEGDHMVALRGPGDEGARRTLVHVTTGATTPVTLVAGVLPGTLRIESDPPEARVFVDGREVGRGVWTGEVPSGEHVVDVTSPWHVPQRLRVSVSSATPAVVRPALERVRRLYLEGFIGVGVLAQTRASISGCEGTCIGNPGGARLGYALLRGFDAELFAFGLDLPRRITGPATEMVNGVSVATGAYQQEADLDAGFATGLSIAARFFERTPLTLRWQLGLVRILQEATGTGYFAGTEQTASGGKVALSPIAGPEVRFGYRFGPTVVMDGGVGALFFHVGDVSTVSAHPGVQLPAGPLFSHGLGWVFPLTFAVHVDVL